MGKSLSQYFNTLATPPAGWSEGFFKNSKGQNIRYGRAPAMNKQKKGTVLLTHGYNESIDIYFETIKKYQEQGFDVWAMDWAGMGKSDGDSADLKKKPSAEHFSRHVTDLEKFIQNVVKRDKTKPFFMSTHSFGGHIGLMYLQKHQNTFDGAIMSAPMFDIRRAGLSSRFRPAIRWAFNVLSKIGFKDTPIPQCRNDDPHNNDIKKHCDNADNLRSHWKEISQNWHPDTALERPTFGWVASAYDTIEDSLQEEKLRALKTPILVGSAACEDLVDNEAHERVAELSGGKTILVTIPDAGHNLFHNTNNVHNKWWTHISGFIKDCSTAAQTKTPKAANDDKNTPAFKKTG